MDDTLTTVIDRLAHLLPAQGPISIFIHHNTLHAFESLPFEEAVEQVAGQLGCQPYLSEARYRNKLASGRILARDVEALLREQMGADGTRAVAGIASRFDLWRAVVLHGIPDASGRELSWILDETSALTRFRHDVPARARAESDALGDFQDVGDRGEERQSVRHLWEACLEAVANAGEAPARVPSVTVRHGDLLKVIWGIDTDAWIHPPLIRFIAGYLDQGLAHWSMPDRNRGIHGCFPDLYETSRAANCGPWAHTLPELVADDNLENRSALASVEHSLNQLGVREDERESYLTATLLPLRGWAGMIRQIEERPDRVPARELQADLTGYLAVRLLFERAAVDWGARRLSFEGRLSDLRSFLRASAPAAAAPTNTERAWPL